MDLTPEEELELASLEKQLGSDVSPDKPGFFGELAGGTNSFMGNVGQWAKDVGHAGMGFLKSAVDIPFLDDSNIAKIGPDGKLGIDQNKFDAAAAQMQDNLAHPMANILPGGLGEIIPGTRTAESAASDALNGTMQPAGAYGKSLRQELATVPVAAAAYVGAKAGPGVVKGTVQGLRDTAKGLPRENIMAAIAPNEESYGNMLNAGESSTAGENRLVQRVDDYHQEFTDANPVKGIDPSTGRQGFAQFKQNLDNAYVTGVNTRNGILQKVADAENLHSSTAAAAGEPTQLGVSFADIPETVSQQNGLSAGLDLIARTMPEGEAGVEAARNYIKNQFGVTAEVLPGGDNFQGQPANPGRVLSATELNETRMKVDGQLRALGAYDLSNMPPGVNPSAITSEIASLKYYRGQLDSLLKDHITSMVGEADATAFDKAGGQIGMAITYKDLANRFQAQTGQAFTPGSAKRVPPGKGILDAGGKWVDQARALLPGEDTTVQTRGLQRETTALQNLQMLVDYNNGSLAKPAPRGWTQIKSSFNDLNNVGMIAVSLGLVKQPQDLLSLPDDLARRIVGQVAAAAPQAFVPTPDKVNVIDGQFQDPLGKEVVINQSLELASNERAMRIGATFTNKYLPSTPAAPVLTQKPALPVTMDKLMGAFDDVPQTSAVDSSYDKSQSSNMSQLEKMTALHERDIQ